MFFYLFQTQRAAGYAAEGTEPAAGGGDGAAARGRDQTQSRDREPGSCSAP